MCAVVHAEGIRQTVASAMGAKTDEHTRSEVRRPVRNDNARAAGTGRGLRDVPGNCSSRVRRAASALPALSEDLKEVLHNSVRPSSRVGAKALDTHGIEVDAQMATTCVIITS